MGKRRIRALHPKVSGFSYIGLFLGWILILLRVPKSMYSSEIYVVRAAKYGLYSYFICEKSKIFKKKVFEIAYDSLSWTSLLSCQRKYSSFSSNRRVSELDRFWSKLHGIDTEQFFSYLIYCSTNELKVGLSI